LGLANFPSIIAGMNGFFGVFSLQLVSGFAFCSPLLSALVLSGVLLPDGLLPRGISFWLRLVRSPMSWS
jgi:hypothetical protein